MKKELEEERKRKKYEEELDSDDNDVVVNIADKSLSGEKTSVLFLVEQIWFKK